MQKSSLAWYVAVVSILQAGCGGGGGGSSAPAPAPTPVPPSIDGTLTRLTTATHHCGSNGTSSCLGLAHLSISDSGEYTVFWTEQAPGALPTMKAANGSAASGAVMSQAVVDTNLNNIQSQIVAGNARQFYYLNQPSPSAAGQPIPAPPPGGDYPIQSRRITMADAGAATVSATVNAAASFHMWSSILRDVGGNLAAFTAGTTAPFPQSPLGGGDSLKLVTPAATTYAHVDTQAYASFNSIAPRGLSVVIGQQASTDARSVYLDQVVFDSGQILPIGKISTAPVGTGAYGCPMTPIVRSDAAGEFAVAWLQLNANQSTCDLYVDGVRLSIGAATQTVALSGKGGGALTAVWIERDANAIEHLLWSHRNATGAVWSAPTALPGLSDAVFGIDTAVSGGPADTLAVYTVPCQTTGFGSCNGTTPLVYKYVNGTWTVKSLKGFGPTSNKVVAINASGQGVLVAPDESCSDTTFLQCEAVDVYRF